MYGGCLGRIEPMKDVVACEKLRGGGKQPLIRRCPNGETYVTEGGMSIRRGAYMNGNHAK